MTIRDEVLSHRQDILNLGTQYGVINIRLFGSVARGTDGPNSDIDLLIDPALPIQDSFGFIDFQEQVSALLEGRPVDIVFAAGLFPPFREAILREAIAL